jgi:hypothetical protein
LGNGSVIDGRAEHGGCTRSQFAAQGEKGRIHPVGTDDRDTHVTPNFHFWTHFIARPSPFGSPD